MEKSVLINSINIIQVIEKKIAKRQFFIRPILSGNPGLIQFRIINKNLKLKTTRKYTRVIPSFKPILIQIFL